LIRSRAAKVMLLATAVSFVAPAMRYGLSDQTVRAAGTAPRRLPPLVEPSTETAIEKGLKYLASRQYPDGSWREVQGGGYSGYPIAMTALASMALAGSGSTPVTGPYAPNLNKAVTYLLKSAQPNGLICRPGEEESRSMYGHGFSMLFLSQVLGMEGDPDRMDEIRTVLQRGVELTGKAQSNLGGWIYTPDSGGDEGSVTITQVQGLRSCRDAGIAVPKRVIQNAMGYLDKSIQPDGGIAYRVGMVGSRPPISAAAVACWFNAGEYNNPKALRCLQYSKRTIGTGPMQAGVLGHFFYAHLYLAQVLYLAGEKEWTPYYPIMRDQLVNMQSDDGSWTGDSVGRIYGTSLALTILQLPYNYLPIYQR